jgi:hypothetical protein
VTGSIVSERPTGNIMPCRFLRGSAPRMMVADAVNAEARG